MPNAGGRAQVAQIGFELSESEPHKESALFGVEPQARPVC
ncbi:hypothetical protein DFP74_4716 [Nocardiopsis sp. Huas11]|nr:hypothetical protein DFP74_4716 [Nocardiopsis sp. Huas11]